MTVRDRLRGFRVLLTFSFGVAPWQAGLFLVSGAVMSLFGPATSYFAKLLVDAVVAGSLQRGLIAAGLLALTVGISLINVLYYIDLLFTVVEKAGAALDQRLMTLIGGIPGLAHHEHPAYLDQSELLREHRAELSWMTNATAGMVRVIVQLAASAVLLVTLQPVLLLLPLVGVVSFVAGKRAQDLQMRAREVTAEPERLRKHLFGLATSAPAGKEVRVFGLADELLRRHRAASDAAIRARHRADWQSAGLQAVGSLTFGLAYAGAIGLVLVRAIQGQATPGDVILIVGLAAGMNGIVSTAVGYGTHFLSVLRVARWYLWLEDYARSAQQVPSALLPVPERLASGIQIQGVSFRYPGIARPALANVSLHLPAGAVVALVGENGAGKTSLIKLLCRFYEPDEGRVLVDGEDLRRLPIEGWRARVSAAFQDFSRFEVLVRETVGVGRLARAEDRPAVQAALARAGAEDIPTALPAGLETQLGKAWDGGVDLSGGQWQKLALARAMMRSDPLLVVFDEPTAALDAPTEHALFERFAAAARGGESAGTVTLLVSHRFSTVRMADLIVVLDRGRIVEQGSHQELMQRDGLYAELYRLQSRAYR
ncbi:MAG TPA: ABC transporter ATP-binding protein [Thermomicrobiaceae bacterium]|nr:ABC transporter ATP-binding protein [Thermomicrobiaceae bacterium]